MAGNGSTLLDMAKRTPPPNPQRGRPRGRKPTYPFGARIDPKLGAAFDAYLESLEPKPTATSVIEMMLRRFLQSQNFWPPPGSKP